uniref:Uncharacterized protein n=1 Tax=Nannospalax galili TaxID=1026970 RepID=A0A8C6W5U3_NANGA
MCTLPHTTTTITFHSSSHSRSSRAFLCRAVTALTSDWTTFAFISTCSATVWACSMLSWKTNNNLEGVEVTYITLYGSFYRCARLTPRLLRPYCENEGSCWQELRFFLSEVALSASTSLLWDTL